MAGEGERACAATAGPNEPVLSSPGAAVELEAIRGGARTLRRVAMVVARHLALPLAEARLLVSRLPVTLPCHLARAQAERLARELCDAGARARAVQARRSGEVRCASHPSLAAEGRCQRCQAATCALCRARAEGAALCQRCLDKRRRSRRFYRLRVAVLLAVLAGVLLWAWRDLRRRSSRLDWTEPVTVGFVVLRQGQVDPDAVAELRVRTRTLQQRLATEYQRYHPGSAEPFHLVLFGPVDVGTGPPAPAGDGWLDRARHSYALWRYLRPIDEAADVAARGLDSRVYLLVRPPSDRPVRTVEGMGEQGGRIGIVEVELDDTMVDFALFVAAHELFHTLGATDKYDASGRAMVPDGLAEPARAPLYPQRYAELMARHVPLSPSTERPPESLAELCVGIATAREIGWFE